MRLDLKYNGFCGEVSLSGDADRPAAREKLKRDMIFTKKLSENLAKLYSEVSEAFFLCLCWRSSPDDEPTWEIVATNRDYAERKEIFRSNDQQIFFTTCAYYNYYGLNPTNTKSNYYGSVEVELVMPGKKQVSGNWHVDVCAENLVDLTLAAHYRRIIACYKECITRYVGGPSIKSWSIDALGY